MANDVQYLIDMLYEMIDGAKGVLMSPDKCIMSGRTLWTCWTS